MQGIGSRQRVNQCSIELRDDKDEAENEGEGVDTSPMRRK